MIITGIQLYIGMVIAGIFTGLGSALGNYLAQKHLIEKLNKLNNLIKRKK